MSDKKNKKYCIEDAGWLKPYKQGDFCCELLMHEIVFTGPLAFINALKLMAAKTQDFYVFVEPTTQKAIISSRKSFKDAHDILFKIIRIKYYNLDQIKKIISNNE
jgi:hypothetical protein